MTIYESKYINCSKLTIFLVLSPKGAHYALFTPDVCHADSTAKYGQCSVTHFHEYCFFFFSRERRVLS